MKVYVLKDGGTQPFENEGVPLVILDVEALDTDEGVEQKPVQMRFVLDAFDAVTLAELMVESAKSFLKEETDGVI